MLMSNKVIPIMAGYSFPVDQKNAWGLAVEASLERGQSAVLDLGAAGDLLENLPALVALHAFAEERRDPTEPVVLAGGNPLFWLAATLVAPGEHGATPLRITYSGGDITCHIAAVQAEATSTSRSYELPPGFASLLAPGAQAGAWRWEALPLAWAQAAQQPTWQGATPSEPTSISDKWLAWVGVAFALLLTIGALLL